jgi:hypothetical protein
MKRFEVDNWSKDDDVNGMCEKKYDINGEREKRIVI